MKSTKSRPSTNPINHSLTPYPIRPKKNLGQNFLTDDAVLRREVACAEIAAGDIVLEIGAGIGNLTQLLLERAGQVVAVEQDRQFGPCLKDLQRRYEHLKVIWGDALAVDFPRFDKAVANLPYQVALPIVFKLLNQRFGRAVLMLPKRLAQRLCATVGQKGYSRIGVAVGRLAQVEWIEQVGKDAFFPRPEVESALVLIKRTKPKFAVPSDDFFRQVLESLFARRQEQVQQIVPPAALASLSKKIKDKPVYTVTPREFGAITRAWWPLSQPTPRTLRAPS